MKETLKPGLATTQSFRIDPERVTTHMGDDMGVYATPFLVRDIERVCHALLQEHIDEDENSVGTYVDLKHLAPSLKDMQVTINARVAEIDRRAVTFEVTVHDDFEELARCRHGRFVVSTDRLKERLAAKAQKMREG